MKENNKKVKKQERKHREIYVVLLLLLCISVGFSYLTTQLEILGNTTVKKQSWNIHFGTAAESSGNITGTNRAIADRGSFTPAETNNTTSISFTAELEYPGDYYEFTVPVVNAGTIDAMIADEEFSEGTDYTNGTTPASLDYSYIHYSATYADLDTGNTINPKDGLHAGKNIVLKIRVEYDKDVTNEQVNDANFPSEGYKFTSTYSVKYIQADNTATYKSVERNNS